MYCLKSMVWCFIWESGFVRSYFRVIFLFKTLKEDCLYKDEFKWATAVGEKKITFLFQKVCIIAPMMRYFILPEHRCSIKKVQFACWFPFLARVLWVLALTAVAGLFCCLVLHYQSGAHFTAEEAQILLLYWQDYDLLATASSHISKTSE